MHFRDLEFLEMLYEKYAPLITEIKYRKLLTQAHEKNVFSSV